MLWQTHMKFLVQQRRFLKYFPTTCEGAEKFSVQKTEKSKIKFWYSAILLSRLNEEVF